MSTCIDKETSTVFESSKLWSGRREDDWYELGPTARILSNTRIKWRSEHNDMSFSKSVERTRMGRLCQWHQEPKNSQTSKANEQCSTKRIQVHDQHSLGNGQLPYILGPFVHQDLTNCIWASLAKYWAAEYIMWCVTIRELQQIMNIHCCILGRL